MNSKGFSLVEMAVVLLIIGIFASVGFGALKWIKSAKVTKTKHILSELKMAITSYKTILDTYPNKLEDLMVKPSGAVPKWTKFVDDEDSFKDAWGREFEYKVNPKGSKPAYELYSNGPDEDSEDESERISVWSL